MNAPKIMGGSVSKIEIMQVSIPLRIPVQLGEQTISLRDYTVLRFTLDDGVLGFALGYDRGLPLFDLTVSAARQYAGGSTNMRAQLRTTALGATPAPRAALSRGVSLCDIALWDAWCQSIAMPLWAVLGAQRVKLPIMPVIGYGMTPERAARESSDLASRGFRHIKIMIDGRDFALDRAVMEAVAHSLPANCSFGIDAHWSWNSWMDAAAHCRMAEKLGAIFIEDPVAPTLLREAGEIAKRIDTPIAMGEDVMELQALRDLVSVTGIMRLDASVIGGVSGAIEAMALAKSLSRPVIPHVFPRLHAHFGFADMSMIAVEAILPEVGADPIEDFFLSPLPIADGYIEATNEAGCGLAMDWDRLGEYAKRTEVLEQ